LLDELMPVVVPDLKWWLAMWWRRYMAWWDIARWCMAFGAGMPAPDGPVLSGGGEVCAKATGAASSEAASNVEARSLVLMAISLVRIDARSKPAITSWVPSFPVCISGAPEGTPQLPGGLRATDEPPGRARPADRELMPTVVPCLIWAGFARGAGGLLSAADGPVESGGGEVCAKAMAGAPSSEAANSVEARSLVLMGLSGVNRDAGSKPSTSACVPKSSLSVIGRTLRTPGSLDGVAWLVHDRPPSP
jgi:hypothetical protein